MASPPRVRAQHLDPPGPEQVMQLIEAATKLDPDFGCYLLVAATTGARRGELCGLQWHDVDLESRNITISRSVVEAAHSQLVAKDTKTHSARRIALDEATARRLLEHRERCEKRAIACNARLPSQAYIFSAEPDGSRPWAPNDVTKNFIRLRNQVGLSNVRLHDLRHFAATRLLAAGVSVRTVSGRLGHANAATTLGVYAHFVEESDREAAEKLGGLLTESPATSGPAKTATRRRT
jgi:integrase